jgi:hypothetical protein
MIVGRAIAVTCPIIDGVVRGMAAVASDTAESAAADEHPDPIRKPKSNALTKSKKGGG